MTPDEHEEQVRKATGAAYLAGADLDKLESTLEDELDRVRGLKGDSA